MQIDDANWAASELADAMRATRALGIVLLIVLAVALIGTVSLLRRVVRSPHSQRERA